MNLTEKRLAEYEGSASCVPEIAEFIRIQNTILELTAQGICVNNNHYCENNWGGKIDPYCAKHLAQAILKSWKGDDEPENHDRPDDGAS